MSTVVWSLEYDGERRPLKQWGIENAMLELCNQMTDTMKLVVAGEDADAVPEFEFEKKVVLFRDAVRMFTGWITQLPASGDAAGDRQQYVAEGPWYWLDKTVYQQPRWVVVDPDQPSLGGSQIFTGRAIYFQSATGEKSSAGEQAQDVVDYCIFKTTNTFPGTAVFTRADFEDLVADAPWESGLDLSCAEALRRCTRWMRDAVAYWDYTQEIPVLHVDRRASLTPAVVDLNATPKSVESYSITSRRDLVPRGVLIRFQQTKTNAATGAQWTQYTDQTAGAADGGPRCISATLSLSGSGPGAEPIPVGLATDFYASLATLPWEGTITLREADPTGLLAVGNVLNIEGGKTAWETMAAVIQSVTIDIAGRKSEARFGPADQLGPQDFLDQVRFQRGEPAGNGAGGRFDGTPENPQPPRDNPPSPPPPGQPPGGHDGPPMKQRKLTICGPDGPEDFVVTGFGG